MLIHQWVMQVHYMWLSWKGKEQLSTTMKIKWTNIHFCSFTLLAYSSKECHPPTDKYMLKVISDHTRNMKFCRSVELCKLVLEVLSFCMLSVWVNHQIVNIIIQDASSCRKFCGIQIIPKDLRGYLRWQGLCCSF